MKNILKVYDTSALLSLSDNLVLDSTCYVSTLVINELENIKTSFNKDSEIKAQARQVVRILKSSTFTSNLTNHAKIEKMVKSITKFYQIIQIAVFYLKHIRRYVGTTRLNFILVI